MKKKVLMVVVCVLLLVLAAAPAAGASTPAMGEWSWHGGEFIAGDVVDGSQYFHGWELGNWTGTFEGSSVEPFAGVIRPDGSLWAVITVNFKGAVDGARGKFVMSLTVDSPPDATMHGEWAIVQGSGQLKGLCGVGTWIYTHDEGDRGFADYVGTLWWK